MHMADGAASVVLSSMLGWDLYQRLGAAEMRCLRLVCHELLQAVDALNNKWVLRLDSPVCSDTATAATIALFHSKLIAAKRLQVVQMSPLDAYDHSIDTYYMLTASRAQSQGVHCWGSRIATCALHRCAPPHAAGASYG